MPSVLDEIRDMLRRRQRPSDVQTAIGGGYVPIDADPELARRMDLVNRGTLARDEARQASPVMAFLYDDVLGSPGAAANIVGRTVAAPKAISAAKRFLTGERAGNYRGSDAFGGINPQKLGAMRRSYLSKMEEGAPGRLWYDDASRALFRLTGEVPQAADDLANMLAVTSAGTGVSPNLMHGAKAWNQRAVGAPIKAGRFPNDMGRSIDQVLAEEAGSASGLKRSPFSAGLSVEWRGADFANRPVHDIHDIRAWGITDPATGLPWSKGAGDAGHRFLDEQGALVTNRANERTLAGADDWTPYRSQAAAWVAQKAAKEGVPVANASRSYADFIPEQSALVTREWVPGDNTGHLTGALRAPDPVRRAFSDDLEAIIRGPQGTDALAQRMGALSDTVLPNRGVYEGSSNPGYASVIPVGKQPLSNYGPLQPGVADAFIMDPASQTLVESVAAAHGLLGTQKQAAYNAFTDAAPVSRAGGYRLNTGTPMSEADLAVLNSVTDRLGMDVPMVDPRGARILDFSPPGTASRRSNLRALRQMYPEATITPHVRSSDIFPVTPDYSAPEKYSTLPYIEKIEAAGPRVVAGFDEAMRTMAPQVLEKTARWAAQEGWIAAPWFGTAMEALATGGLAKLKQLQAAGIVPAAFLTGVGAAVLGGSTGDVFEQ